MQTKKVVLLLEDELILRELLAQALTAQGFQVYGVGSREGGEAALRMLGWQIFDVVITDINLHRDPLIRGGFEFFAHWRTHHPAPPFIFMSGLSEFPSPPGINPSARPSSERDGIYYLAKPFQFGQLVTLIHFVLGR